LPSFSDSFYKLIGQTPTHPYNNYARAEFIAGLRALAANYQARWPNLEVLCFNDLSLKFGGRFDWKANWTSPHSEHMLGESADLRTQQINSEGCLAGLPHANIAVRTWFQQELFTIFGHRQHCIDNAFTSPPSPHYHLRYRTVGNGRCGLY
jgi:hypothetical protein